VELEGVLGEALQLCLALGKAGVKTGVLDGIGHEVGDVGEDADVVGTEVSGTPSVDVDDANDVIGTGDHRHRREGDIVLATQLEHVLVSRVGPLVLDDHGLGALRHPAGDAFAHSQFDPATWTSNGGVAPPGCSRCRLWSMT
jgi:hypothetical protein